MKRLPFIGLLTLLAAPSAMAFHGASTELTLAEGTARNAVRIVAEPQNVPVWQEFVGTNPGRWRAIWNADTAVANRIWGEGIAAPNSSGDKRAAEIYARAFLRTYVDMLAPGAAAEDFRLASNVVSPDGVRSIGFFQTQDGIDVDGGQVSFRFKHDRLVVIGSEAWPRLTVATFDREVDADQVGRIAQNWVDALYGTRGELKRVGEPMIRAIVLDDGTIRATKVRRAMVRTTKPIGLWEVDVELGTGRGFAMRQALKFASGTVELNVPERRPGLARSVFPAPYLEVSVDGVTSNTDENGVMTWDGAATTTVTLSATGIDVDVQNQAGELARLETTITDGASAVWDASGDELVDAQIITYFGAHHARQFVATLAPNLSLFNTRLPAIVNIADECNAFWDGEAISFMQASNRCENTGRLPDVVRHEYGHAVHQHAIIPGVGSFDSPLSEGISDYLAATIVDDPGMGRGFFYSSEPLRHLDPEGDEAVYPDDQGESHTTGLIIGGALWDLRKTMIEMYGQEDGARRVDEYWFAIIQRSTGITTAYVETLLSDDDDGNLANGTPHVCEISAAFDLHGLALGYTPGPELGELTFLASSILLPVGEGTALCPAGEYVGAKLTWQIRGNPATLTTVDMERLPEGFGIQLPNIPEGEVLNYKVDLELGTGRVLTWPDNPADPMYERFVGEVRPLYCTDFEEDPFAAGWESEMTQTDSNRNEDEWEWGPLGEGGGFFGPSGDPTEAYSGNFVVGQDLGTQGSGRYGRSKSEELRVVPIPVTGETNVRLQYYRWLTVEDGDADQAQILVHGTPVWQNVASGTGEVHHLDREWRFHDVDLSHIIAQNEGRVPITFSMASNRWGSAGGWTIDDFCVVAFDGPSVVCGDGEVGEGEACDDGNQLAGDGCELDCTLTPAPVCGNGTVEMTEACDDGNTIDGDGCESNCIITIVPGPDDKMLEEPGDTCGCTTTANTGRAYWLAVLGIFALFIRRRR